MEDHDRPFHCVKCHKMFTHKRLKCFKAKWAQPNKPIRPDRLLISICLGCSNTISSDDHEPIMASVKKGWEIEIRHWNQKDKDAYDKEYGNLEIRSITK